MFEEYSDRFLRRAAISGFLRGSDPKNQRVPPALFMHQPTQPAATGAKLCCAMNSGVNGFEEYVFSSLLIA